MEARVAHQLIASPTAENHLATHEKVVALSVTKLWKAGVSTLHRLWENAKQQKKKWFPPIGSENSSRGFIPCYLCSFCHLHYTGACMYKCRNLLCSDIWRVCRSRTPEHTRPHLITHITYNRLVNWNNTQHHKSVRVITKTGWWISSPFSTVGAVHFGVSQQVKSRVTLIFHRASSVEICSLKPAILQRLGRPTGHPWNTQIISGSITSLLIARLRQQQELKHKIVCGNLNCLF